MSNTTSTLSRNIKSTLGAITCTRIGRKGSAFNVVIPRQLRGKGGRFTALNIVELIDAKLAKSAVPAALDINGIEFGNRTVKLTVVGNVATVA
jgi:hypothetical protein